MYVLNNSVVPGPSQSPRNRSNAIEECGDLCSGEYIRQLVNFGNVTRIKKLSIAFTNGKCGQYVVGKYTAGSFVGRY